jgi:hypothetical protein
MEVEVIYANGRWENIPGDGISELVRVGRRRLELRTR